MNNVDMQYGGALAAVMEMGEDREERTGTGARSLFSLRIGLDISERFPLLTGKAVHFRSVAEELFWFMRGETNINTLGATIWDEWADDQGELGPIYGKQWRDWDSRDQLADLLETIQRRPTDRRQIVSAWNVRDLNYMALPPCHLLYQTYVRGGEYLDLQVYQRSCDMFLGVPFNLASYSLLVYILAYMSRLKPGHLYWIGGDCHVYHNHFEAVEEYLSRDVVPESPKLEIVKRGPCTLDNWTFADLDLDGYEPLPRIPAPVAV